MTSAATSTTCRWLNPRIHVIESVTTRTMRLTGVDSTWIRAAQNILGESNRLKMRWSHATSHTAKMIKNKSVRYRTTKLFIHEPVNLLLPSIDTHTTVTTRINRTSPQPATSLLIEDHSVIETDKNRIRHGYSI